MAKEISNLITFNTYKFERGGLLVDMFNQFNARVGDQGTELAIQWETSKTETKINLKERGLHFFGTGSVGQYLEKLEDGTGFKMSADASTVEWEDKDEAGSLDDGITVVKLPKQFFPQKGIFFGYFGLKDRQGNIFTSVNVWFRVLGGVPTMGAAIPYFVTEFDEVLERCNGKIVDALAELREKYQAEVKKNEDMSAETRAALSKLADSVGAVQAQIDAGNVVTRLQFNELANKITDTLSKMRLNPQAFGSKAELEAAYPNGNDQLNVTVDNGHLWIWKNGWQDCGQYQTAGLSDEVKQQIGDLMGIFLKDYLIKNGSFSNGQVAPATPTGSPAATLSVVNFSNRNWLRIASDSSVSYGGAAWKVPVEGIKFPLHFETDVSTNDTAELDFYVLGLDAQGNYLGNNYSQLLYKIINKKQTTSHVAFNFNLPPALAGASQIELRIQIPGEMLIHGINVTGIRMYSLYTYNKEYSDNFLAHTVDDAHMDNFSAIGNGSATATKEIVNIDNKNWLSISTGKGTWNGLSVAEVPNPNLTLGQDCPIHFETCLWNTNGNLTFNVALTGTQKDNTLFSQDIKTLQVDANEITQLTADFQIASELHDSADLSIRIQCADEIALQDLKFANFVLKYDNVVGDTNENNLLLRNQLSGLPIVRVSNGDSHNLQTVSLNGQQWLQIKNVEANSYSGFNLNSAVINPYETFYFETDVLSNDQTKINVYAMGLDDHGAQIGADADAILIKTITVRPTVINHIVCDFKLPTAFQSAKYVNLRIQQPENKPFNLMIANANLSYDNPVSCVDNLIPKGHMSQSVLPQTSALGSQYTFSTYYMNGEEWTWLELPNSAAWQGIGWDVDSNYDPSRELEFSLDVATDIERNLQLLVVPYDAQGAIINNQSQLIGQIHLSGNNKAYHISKQFKLDDRFKNCKLVNIRIQDPGNNALRFFVKNIRLWYVTDSDEKYGLPIVKINGDLSGMTKDDAKQVTYEYLNGNTVLTGYAKLKWQGNSSTMWDKKGYRLQPFADSAYSNKQEVQFLPQWSPTSKINLKAYYTDGLLSRDVVNANIGADVASTNLSLPNDLKSEDNFGFIDGLPIALIFNDEFAGIYSFNTARPDFSYTKYAIMGNGYSNVTNFTSTNKADVKLDGSDFESLNPETVTGDEKSAVGDLVTWVATSTDENFKADFEKHLDLKTTIDYFILGNLLASVDSFGKNQIFLTWDGQKWFMQAYDLDTTFGISWEGKKQDLPTGLIGTENNLFNRLSKLFASEISARYAELRTWLTPAYVLDKYKKRIDAIGVGNYKLEFAEWTNPSKDIATYKQLKNAVLHQFSLLDQIWLKK